MTPRGNEAKERALSASEPLVFFLNSSHSEASNEATFSGEIGVDVVGSDLNVCL